jgi:hypothetical protein
LVAGTFSCEEVQFGLNGRSDCAILYKNNDCRLKKMFFVLCNPGKHRISAEISDNFNYISNDGEKKTVLIYN